MRITASQLRRIIKEETRRAVLNEVDGNERSALAMAIQRFDKVYANLEAKLVPHILAAKGAGVNIEEVISQNTNPEKSSANAIRGMEVVRRRDTPTNIGFGSR